MTTTPTVNTTSSAPAPAATATLARRLAEDGAAGQLPAVRHGRRARGDRDPVPDLDGRDSAQAAERHQHRPAERLHPDPGDRDGDRHHLRSHRSVRRIDRGLHRRDVGGADDPQPHAVAGRGGGLSADGRGNRCVARLLDRLRRHPVVHRDAWRACWCSAARRSICSRASPSRRSPAASNRSAAASCPRWAPTASTTGPPSSSACSS